MIIPGILRQTLEEIGKEVEKVDGVCEVIQIDVADGIQVDGKSFKDIEKISRIIHQTPLEIHLMVEKPLKILPVNKGKIDGVSKVCTQVTENTLEVISKLKDLNYEVGVSLNPEEDIDLLKPFLNKVDYVQFMGVIPGKQGNKLIPEVLSKITDFKTKYSHITTQIDGGVNDDTLPQVLKSGVDNIVIGSAIFNSENPRKKLLELKKTAYGRTYNT